MRVVPATLPFSTGTLRSTRTSTRLPLTSASSSVWNMSVLILRYEARCRKTDSPRLLAYMGRYRSVLYMVATSTLRGPSSGSGIGTSSYRPFTSADIRPVLPSNMASYAMLPNVKATSRLIQSD
jgi:hypothetical protein